MAIEIKPISLSSRVERHHREMPRYLEVPSSTVAEWRLQGTTVVEGTINEIPIGRRSLKRWGDERWFIDLPAKLYHAAGVDTGDHVRLNIRIASTELPTELAGLLSRSSAARETWGRLMPRRQRMVREHVAAAKRPQTRDRWARCALGVGDEV